MPPIRQHSVVELRTQASCSAVGHPENEIQSLIFRGSSSLIAASVRGTLIRLAPSRHGKRTRPRHDGLRWGGGFSPVGGVTAQQPSQQMPTATPAAVAGADFPSLATAEKS